MNAGPFDRRRHARKGRGAERQRPLEHQWADGLLGGRNASEIFGE